MKKVRIATRASNLALWQTRHVAAKLKARLIEIRFEDWKDDARTPNVISFLAKRARGTMARYIIENRLERAEQLKAFDTGGYAFQADRSSDEQYVFGRPFVPAT